MSTASMKRNVGDELVTSILPGFRSQFETAAPRYGSTRQSGEALVLETIYERIRAGLQTEMLSSMKSIFESLSQYTLSLTNLDPEQQQAGAPVLLVATGSGTVTQANIDRIVQYHGAVERPGVILFPEDLEE
jgi:hypothetical protein